MALTEQLFQYCERGSDQAFWAEPINAITNAGFICAAVLATRLYLRTPREARGQIEAVLIALVFAIGLGSFLFHTLATRWASLADVLPITVFMLIYFSYALHRFVGLNTAGVIAGLGLFAAALWQAEAIQCRPSFMPVSNARGLPCLNGTAGYLPAFVALVVIGVLLAVKRHPASRLLLTAAGIFLLSMTFRTLDFEWCAGTGIGGHDFGTHFVWHLLNSAVLYMLLRAALLHGSRRPEA